MGDRTIVRCERCGNTRAGSDYEFWYGRISEKTEAFGSVDRTTTSYTIGGHDAAFICDQCIADRRRRLRRVAIILPSVMFLVLFGVGLTYWIFEDEVAGFLALGGMAVLAGPVLAPVLLWQLNRNPDFSRQAMGETYAIGARKKDLRKQGFTSFWTRKGYEALRASATHSQPAIDRSSGGNYSFVRDLHGAVVGMWLRDPAQARNPELLLALLLKHGEPATLALGGSRLVPNTYDASGGTFVMFGGAKAPGET